MGHCGKDGDIDDIVESGLHLALELRDVGRGEAEPLETERGSVAVDPAAKERVDDLRAGDLKAGSVFQNREVETPADFANGVVEAAEDASTESGLGAGASVGRR